MNSITRDRFDQKCDELKEELDEQCKVAMNILNDHFGTEDEIYGVDDLKSEIDYYEGKLADLRIILSKMEDIEIEMPGYYPEEYDVQGNR